jgi:hypothetical protein
MKNFYLSAVLLLLLTTAYGQVLVPLNGALKSDICVVHDSLIYIAYRNTGLQVYAGSGAPSPVNFSIPASEIYALAYVNGALWIGTNNGLVREMNGIITHYHIGQSNFEADTVFSLDTLLGQLVAGTNNGLFIQSLNGWQRIHTGNSALQSNKITNVKTGANQIGLVASGVAYSFSNGQIQTLPFASSSPPKAVLPTPFSQYIITTDSQSFRLGMNGQLVPIQFVAQAEDVALFNGEAQIFCPGRIVGVNVSDDWFRNSGVLSMANHAGRIKITSNGRLYLLSRFNLAIFENLVFIDRGANSFNRKSLDINEVKATYLNGGDMFWDRGASNNPRYNVPKSAGTGHEARHALFALTTWIGGMHNQQLYQSAQTYRQPTTGGAAYQSGPLGANGTLVPNAGQFDRLWKIERFEVESFKRAWQNGEVQNGTFFPSFDFREWPGNHPEGHVMAPFYDNNNDGTYRWQDGDYPLIKGDQAIWFVFNDLDTSRLLTAPPIGVEVHCMAYAFICDLATGIDSVINYTTFLDYKFINKSGRNYQNTHLSIWTAPESNAGIIGMDVLGNGYYHAGYASYFGPANTILPSPAMGIYQLSGPLATPNDGIDNNRNGVVDEAGEEISISNFMAFRSMGAAMGHPVSAQEYFNYSRSIWKDNEPVVFGGTGYPGSVGSTTLPAKFMFPGHTDSVGWGIGGTLQNPIPPPFNWTQWFGPINVSGSAHGTASMGAFEFPHQAERTFSFALIWSLAPTAAQSSIDKLMLQDAPLIKQWHAQNTFPSCLDLSTVSIPRLAPEQLDVRMYPNPTKDRVFLAFKSSKSARLTMYDMQGRLLLQQELPAVPQHEIDVKHLPAGVYILRITRDGAYSQQRLVKQ